MNEVIIHLICPDQKGIIAELTSTLYDANANILSIEQHVDNKDQKEILDLFGANKFIHSSSSNYSDIEKIGRALGKIN